MMKTSNFIAFDFNLFIANLITVGCLLVIVYPTYQHFTNVFHIILYSAIEGFSMLSAQVYVRIKIGQARSFGAKRQQAEDYKILRLPLDGDFPIPPETQIPSVAARCAIAIFPLADARVSAVSVLPDPADMWHLPCGS